MLRLMMAAGKKKRQDCGPTVIHDNMEVSQ